MQAYPHMYFATAGKVPPALPRHLSPAKPREALAQGPWRGAQGTPASMPSLRGLSPPPPPPPPPPQGKTASQTSQTPAKTLSSDPDPAKILTQSPPLQPGALDAAKSDADGGRGSECGAAGPGPRSSVGSGSGAGSLADQAAAKANMMMAQRAARREREETKHKVGFRV